MPQVQLNNDDSEDIDDLMQRRQSEQAAQTPDTWAAANQAYGQAIRAGQDLDLQRPSDVLTYGASLPSGQTPDAAADAIAALCSPAAPIKGLPESIQQANAALRAASNTLSFGTSNNAEAAIDALLSPGGLDRWAQRYDANLQQQHALDEYNAVHRPIATTIGTIGGGLLGLGVLGPMEGALAAAPRLAGAAQLTARETVAILGAGGATGLGNQALSDAWNDHWSTPGDYAGATLGGIAGAGAGLLRLGPARTGAVDGAVTSAAQDILNGRPVSTQQAVESALTGNVFGGVAGIAGRAWSNGLSKTEKGVLGEALGNIRSEVNGEPRAKGPKERVSVDGVGAQVGTGKGAYIYPDGVSSAIVSEDKMGVKARLSRNQLIAQARMGPNFRLNHFLPADIGHITGLPTAGIGIQAVRPIQDQQEMPWD